MACVCIAKSEEQHQSTFHATSCCLSPRGLGTDVLPAQSNWVPQGKISEEKEQ